MSKDNLIFNLKKGLESELYAVELCRELLNILEDDNEKKTISNILKDEERHVKIVEDLISIAEVNYIN